MITSATVKELAIGVGFDLCGIVSPDIIPEAKERLEKWLSLKLHGEMDYMAKEPDRRSNPARVMPAVRSIIMLGLNYYQEDSREIPQHNGRISKYARGKDYHNVIAKKTKAFLKGIKSAMPNLGDEDLRWYVDYGPMLERAYAAKAGLGYIGKNSMLINKDFGSWIFLSEILTSLELEPDNMYGLDHGACGRCKMCLVACPTGAIVENGLVDANKCISYLTIERPEEIPEALAKKTGHRLFGCDICQDVCPKNKKSLITNHEEFLSGGVGEFVNALGILKINDPEDFIDFAAGTPLTRPKLEGLKRNAEMVLSNELRNQNRS